MKKIFLFLFLIFIFFISFFSVSLVKAEEENFSNSKLTIIADTSIRKAEIISEEDKILNIAFNIKNGKGVQSGVKYSVKLIKETGNGQFVVDEKVYNESLTLKENFEIRKEILYNLPVNISGKYTVLITLNNESGLMLGLGVAGQVDLVSDKSMVEILPETCSLSVVDEKNNKSYTLSQGVDIDSAESLSLKCEVVNPSKEDIAVTPYYETHLRNIYGEAVKAEGGDSAEILFKKGEKKIISLVLPKVTTPQAYDIKISLNKEKKESNSIIVHYIIRGASATIQNLSLDKDFYQKGEVAKLALSWSSSADNFPGNRAGQNRGTSLSGVTLNTVILNNLKRECVDPVNQAITEGLVTIDMPIIKECKDPNVILSVKDSNGNILSEKSLSFKTESEIPTNSNKIIFIIGGIIVFLGLTFYIINLRKKENENNN